MGGPALGLFLGIMGGAVSSIISAASEAEMELASQSVSISSPQAYIDVVNGDEYDEFGYLHNQLITDIFDKYGAEFIANADVRTIFMITLEELELNNYDVSCIKANLESNYLQVKDIVDVVTEGGTEDITTRMAVAYPQFASEIAIVDTYIDTYEMLPEDATVDYTVGLRQIIENAAISQESKNVIRAGMSTALGSGNLWVAQ
jgi:hypothetical protein